MLSSYRGLPPAVWTVFAGTVVNRLGFVVVPFLVYFLGDRGIPDERIPAVLGALGVGGLVGPVLGGYLADRLGRRTTLLASLLGAAAALGLLYAAPGAWTMAGAALLLGTASSAGLPPASSIVADATPPGLRQRAYALQYWGVNVGTAVAGVLGGYLAERGYGLLFAVDAATFLAFAVIVVLRLPDVPRVAAAADAGSGAGRAPRAGYGVVLRDRLMLVLLVVLGVQLFVYSLTESVLPLAVRDAGLPPTVYGALAAVNAVVVVLLQPWAAARVARLPQLPALAASGVLVTVGVAATGLAHDALTFGLTVLVWSAGEVIAGGIAAAVVADLAPADARGRYQGAFQWTWGVGRFAALTGGVALYTAGPAVWWLTLGAGLAASSAVLLLRGAVERRLALPDDVPLAGVPLAEVPGR
ncbi:MFS transporter [Antribacter sp. KLBMP9083]|uniref:MFS transporter n=1 Tax=Antribacter soli TaxID=2910976 RepID=A0AA41QFU6_9MICO|nr:MFS transporter [Antribacter soli]MCF4121407.1 MFS transporter [Antribacter soli]